MVEENTNIADNKEANRNWLLVVLVVLIVVVLAIIVIYYFYALKIEKQPTFNKTVPPEVSKSATNDLIPTNAKDPEDFLKKVKEKSVEAQKNYDANLTDFARKRWENLFKQQNNLGAIDWQDSLKFLSQEVQKTADGSTLFKISYKIIRDKDEVSNEDHYYLTLSEEKKKELGLSYLLSNTFISEEDISKNLNQENFVKIGKIKNLSPSLNGE